MRLLYSYIRFLDKTGEARAYRGLDQVELNFSTVDTFSFDPETEILRRKGRKHPLPEHFWDVAPVAEAGESGDQAHSNIYNVNVLSGENGSGKTTAMHCLIDLLDGLHAAVDPAASNRGRMEELGVGTNRALLLFEEEGVPYLLHYMPHGLRSAEGPADVLSEGRGLSWEGFVQPVQLYEFGRWQEFAECQDECGQTIAELLRKTKVVYLTNTLNQHDYERHIGERSQRLRDYFVYDASIGSTIGPDIAQFFPYEVYKQVKYVFDKDQTAKRRAIGESLQVLQMPDALRLHLRMELEEKAFSQEGSSAGEGSEAIEKQVINHGEDSLSSKLGRLCVAAYAQDLNMQIEEPFRPVHNYLWPQAHSPALDVYKTQLAEVEKQFSLAVRPQLCKGHTGPVCSVCFSPDDRLLASGSADGAVRLWDASTGAPAMPALPGHKDWVRSVCFSPDGRLLASGSWDGSVRLWDPSTGQPAMPALEGHGGNVYSVCFSPDGRLLASGSADGAVRLWDASTGELAMAALEGHRGGVASVCFSPDGRLLASGSDDGSVRLWDASTGEPAMPALEGRGGRVLSVCFSPDGRLLASASWDGTVRLWDASMGQYATPALEGRGGRVLSVCFSPDGRLLASGSDDGSVRLWDASTGEPAMPALEGRGGRVRSVCFSPDGRLLACGSGNGTVRLWDIRNRMTPEEQQAAIAYADQLRLQHAGYIDCLITKEETLFSRFQRIDERTYELSLEELRQPTSDREKENSTKADSLYDDLIEFMERYRAICQPTYTIDFDWGLSSGEENMLRIFANLYHIFDRDGSNGTSADYQIFNNERHADDDAQKTLCDTVLLFMDEADLTLHPEWQRRLINVLATFIPQIYPPSCAKDIQLILSTHSPLILGDIPSENIAYLPPKADRTTSVGKAPGTGASPDKKHTKPDTSAAQPIPEETFGQNIHTILKESFFLHKGTVGDFAGTKINRMAKRLKEIAAQGSGNPGQNASLSDELEEIRQTIQIVAPGVLRTKLTLLYRDAEAAVGIRKALGPTPNAKQLLAVAHEFSPEEQRWLLAQLLRESEADD